MAHFIGSTTFGLNLDAVSSWVDDGTTLTVHIIGGGELLRYQGASRAIILPYLNQPYAWSCGHSVTVKG
jgi:hypothetical protein